MIKSDATSPLVSYDEEKYYLTLLDKDPNNTEAMCKLAAHYESKSWYRYMLKYYLLAVDKGNAEAMYKLGNYYYDIKDDYIHAKKYYVMASEKGNSNAMCKLGGYPNPLRGSLREASKLA